MVPKLRPRFVTDTKGRREAVLLSLKEYQGLVEHLEDLEDIAEARRRRREKTVPYEQVRKELGLS